MKGARPSAVARPQLTPIPTPPLTHRSEEWLPGFLRVHGILKRIHFSLIYEHPSREKVPGKKAVSTIFCVTRVGPEPRNGWEL